MSTVSLPSAATGSHSLYRVHPRFADVLRRNGLTDCEALVSSEQGVALRRLRTRENWRLDLQNGGDRHVTLYLKKHRLRSIRTRLAALLRILPPSTPAREEAQWTTRLESLGIPTMTVAAYAETLRSDGTLIAAFLTEELTGFEQADLFLPQRFSDPSDPLLREIVTEAADLARRFHTLGFNHRDFYTCHFFLKEQPHQSPRFAVHLIDLQRVQEWGGFWPTAWRRRWIIKDLAQLYYSTPYHLISRSNQLRFLKRYLNVTQLDQPARRLVRDVLRKAASLLRKHGRYRPEWPGPN